LRWEVCLAERAQITLILLVALYVINLGYAFEGTGQRLGEYRFTSRTLGGHDGKAPTLLVGGNRFADHRLGKLPIPLPKQYVRGIDLQKSDFERMQWSYLRGRWQQGGWWYYYLYGLGVKMPLGTWILLGAALAAGISLPGYAATWRDELVVLAPLVVVLALASSQTAMNHHLRYVLPVFPFAFVWASKAARAFELRNRKLAVVVGGALVWSVTSSLLISPHHLSYFNELVGGPRGGPNHLLHSNTDWGQDLLYLKHWLAAHPEARPLHLAVVPGVGIEPNLAGIRYTPPPLGPGTRPRGGLADRRLGPRPGWHALSVNTIRARDGRYAYFGRFEPVATAGYSIAIYHVTLEEANRVRRDLGLTELAAVGQAVRAAGRSAHQSTIAVPEGRRLPLPDATD
jgi:hypothetical protein